MDAEIILVGKRLEHSIGNGSDAKLEGGSIGHERGTVAADGQLNFAGVGQVELLKTIGAGDDVVDLRHMD